MISKVFCLIFLWGSLYNILRLKLNSKRSRNSLSFLHCLFVVCMSWKTQYLLCVSSSYFLFDTGYILLLSKHEKLYLYHHAVCLYLLLYIYLGRYVDVLTRCMFIGELSNVYNYVVYDYIQQRKINPTRYISQRIKSVTRIQTVWFILMRCYVFTRMLINESYKIQQMFLLLHLYMVYAMGVLWSVKLLVKQCIPSS